MKTKICMQTLGLLLVLALAGAIFVPVASAEENLYSNSKEAAIEDNYVSIDKAYEQANSGLQDFIDRGMVDSDWSSAKIDSDPIEVYDPNGEKLFYLFYIDKDGKNIGTIKIASSKALGSSILTFGTVPSYIEKDSMDLKAKEYIEENYENAKLLSLQVVCYDYPKIGLSLTFINQDGNQDQVLLDAYDYSKVPESDVASFYDSIAESDISSRVSEWEDQDTYLDDIAEKSYSTKATVTKTLSGFHLYPQEDEDSCAMATAQMISDYYGYTRTQQQIAQTMGVNPGVDLIEIDDMVDNYYKKSVSNGGIGKTSTYLEYVDDVLFNTVKSEINSYHPIHTCRNEGLSRHARAIAGYSYVTTSGNEYVYIYEPWPVNQGDLYWENWKVFQPDEPGPGGKPVYANAYVK
jgi:hypothetical protein